jgi:hypothetical protein
VTVPCCETCREGWSKDDEYFRLVVVSVSAFQGSEVADRANKAVLRSLHTKKRPGFTRLVNESLIHVDVQSEQGIYLGKSPAMKINKRRFDRVADRIIRGLYWHELRTRVPAGYDVMNRQSHFEPVLEQLGTGVAHFVEPRQIADGAFMYTIATVPEDPASSVWLSLLYGTIPFVGFTRKANARIHSRCAE